MVTPNPQTIKPNTKPSSMLGFLLAALVVLTTVFAIVEFSLPRGHAYKLSGGHILTVIGVACAVFGWLIAAIINIRNSIRQHTITTLLQSRLSATYMKYADDLSKHYQDFEKRKAQNPAIKEIATDKVDVMALRYILNYFEFIAIGVKKGDLDEETLRASLRGILSKNVSMSRPWIKMLQVSNPSVYEHVMWLHNRWR